MSLDVSKNNISQLPNNFGNLVNLKYLVLYSNNLTDLPISFGKLKRLRYLDLSSNPLNPLLTKVVGNCLTHEECQKAAKNTVNFMADIQTENKKVQKNQGFVFNTNNQQNRQNVHNNNNNQINSNKPHHPKDVKQSVRSVSLKSNKTSEKNQNITSPAVEENVLFVEQSVMEYDKTKKSKRKSKKAKSKNNNNNNNPNSNNYSSSKANLNNENNKDKNNANLMKDGNDTAPIRSTNVGTITDNNENWLCSGFSCNRILATLIVFSLFLAINAFIIYMVMFENSQIGKVVMNLPSINFDWLLGKTSILRLRVSEWINQFRTSPDEH